LICKIIQINNLIGEADQFLLPDKEASDPEFDGFQAIFTLFTE